MYISISGKNYTKINHLSFAPETDVTGSKIPVNEFSAEIVTEDSIRDGATAALYDDLGRLWAKYWVVLAERLDAETVRVKAQSKITLLGRRKMPAVRYSGAAVSTVMEDIFAALGADSYTLGGNFAARTLDGFCPEQTARERLLWVCFVIGAYVKTFFTDKIEILPIDETERTVPMGETRWKPSVSLRDTVTAVEVTAYSFREGTPQTTDKWVTDGTRYYIVTEQVFSLANPDVPVTAEENVVSVSGVMLINSGNVDDVLSHLAKYYFQRTEMELECINNRQYQPGERLAAMADEETMVSGFAESMSFTFGVESSSKIKLVAAQQRDAARLTVLYLYNGVQIGRKTYFFPMGYEYSIQNPFVDWTIRPHRYIYRPLNEAASGTITEKRQTNRQSYAVALDWNQNKRTLKIVSVDEVTMEERTQGDQTINVVVIK